MTVTCIDLEWTITKKEWLSETSGKKQDYMDNSPYWPDNKLVSVGYQTSDGEEDYLFFHHKELTLTVTEIKANRDKVQKVLDKTTLLIAYHAQSDLTWLRENGFKYEGAIYDPMAFEYVTNYGMKTPLSLKATLEKHGLESKSSILDEYYKKGFNTDEIPVAELEEYGRQDVRVLVKLFAVQKRKLKVDNKIASTIPIMKLTNDFLPVITDMSRKGIKIDPRRLLDIEKEYRGELTLINDTLHMEVKKLMGATPINIDSSEQLSWVFYGIKVHDKDEWAKIFNIGTELRNGVKKKKYPRRMDARELHLTILENAYRIYRTKAHRCESCHGVGYFNPTKKDGTEGKAKRICKTCNKLGVVYVNTDEPAGLQLYPPGSKFAADGGFSTGSDAIEYLLKDKDTPLAAKNFLKLLERRNSITMYLSTFIEGIQKYLNGGYLHMEYNQYVTATGRLSSRFHNLPRGKTFPIKEAVISRFEGGKIMNVDYAQLEFRAAATLANDKQAIQDILDNIDAHTVTMNHLTAAGEPTDRNGAKSRTFKPLYGGTSGTKAEVDYYDWFLTRYEGIRETQNKWAEQAVVKGWTQSPSSRIYAFPYARIDGNGRVSGFTQIANYQVQGFGSDIVMASIVELANAMKGMKSVLIMTIHDSFVLDVHPDEVEKIEKLVIKVLDNIDNVIYSRFKYELKVPLCYEISIGDNWGNQKTIYEG